MATAFYGKGIQKFLEGKINWLDDTIKVVGVNAGAYAFNAATHEFLSDIPSAARITASMTLTNKTSLLGVADADDVTFPAVSGPPIAAVVIYKDTGTESSSPLIIYIDSGTGLPITPNTGDIICTWDNGANRIFKL